MISPRVDRVVREGVLASLATAVVAAALGALWLFATRVASDPPASRFVVWTLAGGVATAVLAVAMSRLFGRGSERLTSLGLPNALTLARLVLIAPTVVLLLDARYPEALVCYFVLFATDVADGIVARRRGTVSEFGVVADPLADVLSTFAIFTVFLVRGWCPLWLYALLSARYAMLFVGSFFLFLASGPFTFRATVPGKIVGVVQAFGACLVIGGAMAGGLDPAIEKVLFAFLGIGFASIVLSQAVIGWRLARRTVSPSGPT
ncbi:MAG TPA: CDP-alcohol phosphatidyltransferase family protein, partial [Candidatus Krumholzibacteria bacterium]|nr:CDP-alcohol phosphatidyltransferase family protein [Candidatus Krumholzibacteria bacterium]